MRQIAFHPNAFDDLKYWSENDIKLLRRIIDLIKDVQRDPFQGIGKPEPLKFEWKGYWSRRINDEHRLVYKITDAHIIIVQCRFYYQ